MEVKVKRCDICGTVEFSRLDGWKVYEIRVRDTQGVAIGKKIELHACNRDECSSHQLRLCQP